MTIHSSLSFNLLKKMVVITRTGFKKLFNLIFIFPATFGSNVSTFCENSRTSNLRFVMLYAVPIFASNEIVAETEANNIYDIQFTDTTISFMRYSEYSNNCISRRRILFFTKPREFDEVDRGVKGNCSDNITIPIVPITNIYMADDESFTLLVSCSGAGVNITVLAGCFKIASAHVKLTMSVRDFLNAYNISNFPLFKVDYKNRLKSFLDHPPVIPHARLDYFQRCPTKINESMDPLLLMGSISIIMVIIVGYLVIQEIKRK